MCTHGKRLLCDLNDDVATSVLTHSYITLQCRERVVPERYVIIGSSTLISSCYVLIDSRPYYSFQYLAEQTTLMDVIALRKGSTLSFWGNVGITGDILLNGFPQEKISFKRCSGYVEQFDVQSAELTVKETIRFSAQLRLDRTNPIHGSPDGLERHIDQIIETLGLTREADFLVGSDEASGLSFEQKKRLSIAVELAASPSLVFLDEPTSGKFRARPPILANPSIVHVHLHNVFSTLLFSVTN